MSSPIRLNKRKNANPCLGKSVFYPDPITSSTDETADPSSSRKTPRTDAPSPHQLPPTAHPMWPPGRITRRPEENTDMIKIGYGLPPVSRLSNLIKQQQDHLYFNYGIYDEEVDHPSTFMPYSHPSLSRIHLNSDGQITPPRDAMYRSEIRPDWWTASSHNNTTPTVHVSEGSSSNALGLFHGSPAVPLSMPPQGEITRWDGFPQPLTDEAMNKSLDYVLDLLDDDIRAEILNQHLAAQKPVEESYVWTKERLEEMLAMELEKEQAEERERQREQEQQSISSVAQTPAAGLRRGSTSELLQGESHRIQSLCYTMPNLPKALPIEECPSPEMARSSTPSPVERSPTPSPIYRIPESSPLIDAYYTQDGEMSEADMEEAVEVEEPADPAPTRRFWRDHLETPDSAAVSRAGSAGPSPLSQFIRDLPDVPDHVVDPYPSLSRALEEAHMMERESADETEDDENASNVSDDDYFNTDRDRARQASVARSEPAYQSRKSREQEDRDDLKLSQLAHYNLEGRILHPAFAAKYTIIDEIGNGGFGFVCVALNREGIEVAVKFIFKNRRPRRPLVDMMGDEPTECFLLRHLSHPNIIGFRDYYEDDAFFYLVQELHGDPWKRPRMYDQHRVGESPAGSSADAERAEIRVATRVQVGSSTPGASSSTPALSPSMTASPFTPFERPGMLRRSSYDLFEAIEKSVFNEQESRYIFRQLVDAVRYMHNNGVYHRDLKDENIVIDRHLRVKIIDFGSAVVEPPSNEPVRYASFTGTKIYAPPEVCTPDGEISRRPSYVAGPADIWCLGIILGMLLGGQSPPEISHAARNNMVTIRDACSDESYEVLESCLQVDPMHRATIWDIAGHPWLNGV